MVVTSENQTLTSPLGGTRASSNKEREPGMKCKYKQNKQTKNLYWQKVVLSSFLLALVLWRSSGTEYYLFAAILSPSQAGQRFLQF